MTDKYLEYIGAPCGTEDNVAKFSTSDFVLDPTWMLIDGKLFITKPTQKYELTYEDIYNLCLRSYKDGYATYTSVEAGHEGYNPDSAVKWILLDLKGKEKI